MSARGKATRSKQSLYVKGREAAGRTEERKILYYTSSSLVHQERTESGSKLELCSVEESPPSGEDSTSTKVSSSLFCEERKKEDNIVLAPPHQCGKDLVTLSRAACGGSNTVSEECFWLCHETESKRVDNIELITSDLLKLALQLR